MKNKIVLILFLLISISFGAMFGNEKKTEDYKILVARTTFLSKELKALQTKLDNVEAKRWQARYEANEYRKIREEKLRTVESELNSLLTKKNIAEERLFREEQQLVELKGEAKEKQERIASFRNSLSSKCGELNDKINLSLPISINAKINAINKIKQNIESGIGLGTVLINLFEYRLIQIKNASSMDIKNSKISDDLATEDALLLRLGNVYLAKSSKSSEKAGLFLHTGKLSGEVFKYRSELPKNIKNEISFSLKSISNNSKQLVMLPFDVLQSPTILKQYSTGGSNAISAKILKIVKSGGVMMIPLGLILIWAFVLIIERLFVYRSRNANAEKLMKSIQPQLESLDLSKTSTIITSSNTSLGRVLSSVLNSAKEYNSRDAAERALDEAVLKEMPDLEKRLSTIAVIGGAAPLLGLLGTVTGMIALFEIITVYGTNDPKLLAGGISEALVTTQAGLIIAVPIMLVHNYLSNKLRNISNDLHQCSLRVLNSLWPKGEINE